LNADQMADMDAIELHGKIISQETRRVLIIGQYSTDPTRRHDHHIGPGRGQITLGLVLTGKIKFAAFSNEYGARFLSEATHDCGTGHAGMTGHEHAFSRQIERAGRDLPRINLRQ
jgi:hypothetical protein